MNALRVLVVDNHDSFVHTLIDYLGELGAAVVVREADEIDSPRELDGHDAVVISPGPGHPEQAGASVQIVTDAAARRLPLLGVCLGHQAIGVAFGGRVVRADELMHGMTSAVRHDGTGLFSSLADPFTAARYHSLVIDRTTLPASLRVTAETDSGVVMAVEHRTAPVWGVQFHPESILTEGGYRLLGTWLEAAGMTGAAAAAGQRRPRTADVMRPRRS